MTWCIGTGTHRYTLCISFHISMYNVCMIYLLVNAYPCIYVIHTYIVYIHYIFICISTRDLGKKKKQEIDHNRKGDPHVKKLHHQFTSTNPFHQDPWARDIKWMSWFKFKNAKMDWARKQDFFLSYFNIYKQQKFFSTQWSYIYVMYHRYVFITYRYYVNNV